MENKSVTAVDWLQEQYYESEGKLTRQDFEQAKEMEKEQISEAYRKGIEEDVYDNPLKTGEEYYNETYKTQNHDNS